MAHGCPPARPLVARALAALLAVALSSGCIGQRSRNDDHVGPFSPRPDARHHR